MSNLLIASTERFVGERYSALASKFSADFSMANESFECPFFRSIERPEMTFFFGLWDEVRAAFAGGVSGVAELLVNWSPMGLLYRPFAAVLSKVGIELPANFSTLGANIIAGLVSGITKGLGSVKDAITSVARPTVTWITLNGMVAPDNGIGSIASLSKLAKMGGAGDAYVLADGIGYVYGAFVIESLNETATYHTREGIPRKIEFSLTLKRVDDSALSAIAGTAA